MTKYAFPRSDPDDSYKVEQPGMTLRDWFAGQALTGFCANRNTSNVDFYREEGRELLVKRAYAMADAMLAARERKS